MKLFIVISLLLAALPSVEQQQDIKQIEFSKISRGYEEHIRINIDSIHILTHDMRQDKPAMTVSRKLDRDEWLVLLNAISEVDLKEIESLSSPTMNRASDAAMHGTISIMTSAQKSYVHGFDDENPNELLRPLMKAIRTLSGRKETR